MLRDVSARNIPPPGDLRWRVVYLRIVLSPEQAILMGVFLNKIFTARFVITPPKQQAGGPHLVPCPRLLIQFLRSYPPYRRPFLYPQPEDAPCRDDRDTLHFTSTLNIKISTEKTLDSNYGITLSK